MPVDGFTLGLIANDLNARLSGARVDKITQPEPDELVMHLRCTGENCMLLLSANASAPRIQLTSIKRANPLEPSAFCMLLRKKLAGCRVHSISQFNSDRIIDIEFDGTDELGDKCLLTLTFECMGRHSNIILHDERMRIFDSAVRVPYDVSTVRQILPGMEYMRPPLQDKLLRSSIDTGLLRERLCANTGLLRKAICRSVMGISDVTGEEMALYAAGDPDAVCDASNAGIYAEKAVEFLSIHNAIHSPCLYYGTSGDPADVCAFPYGVRAHLKNTVYPDIYSAMDAFYTARDDVARVRQKATAIRHIIKRNIERCEKKLALRLQTLKDTEHMDDYRIMGELLTAAIGTIPKGAASVRLTNWYDEASAEIEIPLDVTLSPAHNAQKYFKQYQKMRNAARLAGDQATETRDELAYFEGQLENLEKCTDEADLAEIRDELQRLGYVSASGSRRSSKALPESKPVHFKASSGIHIYAGKNNVQNERLTFSAEPDEYWLHAKDMPGSHVIVKSREPDDETLLLAAEIAAAYSKGSRSSNVPVDITRRKYVKKPSGSKPGFVIFTHQRTVYVTPDADKIRNFEI